jgi:hypothetical protein
MQPAPQVQPQAQQAPPAQQAPMQPMQPNLQIPDQWAPMGGGGPGAPTGMGPAQPQGMGNGELWQQQLADQQAKTRGEKIGAGVQSAGQGMLGLAELFGRGHELQGRMGAPYKGAWPRTGQPGITDLMKILSGLQRPGR